MRGLGKSSTQRMSDEIHLFAHSDRRCGRTNTFGALVIFTIQLCAIQEIVLPILPSGSGATKSNGVSILILRSPNLLVVFVNLGPEIGARWRELALIEPQLLQVFRRRSLKTF